MGVDCAVYVGDTRTQLDRWYVFSPVFCSGEIYSKDEALARFSDLRGSVRQHAPETHYYLHWIAEAYNAIRVAREGDSIVFRADSDDY